MSERLSQLQAELRSATEEAEAVRVEALRIAADLRNARIEDPDHVPTLERALTDVSARTELADERSAAVREQLLELAELVADPVSGLDGEHPIALLPVRIETRFERTTEPRQLLVRIYPDEVHVDSHEPQLTDAELDSARRYWERIWRAGTRNVDAERAAFVELARAVGTPRAAWVARATTPDPAGRPSTPTPDDQPLSPPVLAKVERSPELLTRPAQARMLPDQWIVIGFRGGAEVARASGAVVPERLQMGPSPDSERTPDGMALDEGLRWLVDFDLAERNGMGIRVPLSDDRGFDRLLVLGVKASLDRTASGAHLTQLLNAHRFTTGLGFVRAGTPTNNTDSASAGWVALPSAEELFALEHEPVGDARSNAVRTAAALGLPARTLQRLEHARDADEDNACQMRVALWPATLGYFLETLMAPGLDDPDLAVVRDQFVNYVRGLGPLPTLRIGSQPYGLLPVTSLARWQPGAGDNVRHAKIVRLLRQLAAEWLARTRAPAPDGVPRVGRPGTTPDQELLTILGREALSLSYRVRSVRGPVFSAAATPLMSGLDRAGPNLADAAFDLFDRPTLQVRVRRCEFDPRTVTLKRPLVQHDPLSESDPVPPADEAGLNYLRWLGERGDGTSDPFPGTDADTILFQLLQHSATLADADAAVGISQPESVLARKSALEPELIDPGSTTTATLRRLLAEPASQVSGGTITSNAPIGEFLANSTRPQIVALHQRHVLDAFDRTSTVRAAMRALATRPSAVVDRLAREVLDTCSHRLDAWITSYATRRLNALRKANATGVHLGGYAWVDDLQPKPPPTPVTTPPPEETGPLVEDPTNAGFVHGPSLAHAAAAAVLRSAHLSHAQAGEKDGPLAIDLSSDRVRTALWLVDGIRQGQPLGALLGYRFERGLHDRSHPGLELDQFIRRFRALDPLVAGRNEPVADTVEAVEAVAPTNVVDGLALVHRFTARPTSIDPALAGATEAERAAVKAELTALVDTVDAVADLLLAESTYQLVNGNATRAAASIDSLGSGLAPPPELEVATTPRQGYAYTYRVLTLLPPSNQPAEGWERGAGRPRRLAEPRLERWAGAFLGPATRIRTAARLIPPDNQPPFVREVTLSAAGLCALDLVYDSQGAAGTSAAEAWLRNHLAANPGSGVPAGTRIEVLHVGDDDWPGDSWPPDVLPLDDALELAAALANVLGGSRPATASDLAATTATAATGTDESELAGRAEAVAAAFSNAADALQASLTEAKANPSRATIARVRTALAALAGFGLATTQEAARAETGPQVNDPDGGGRALLTVADLVAAEVAAIRERLATADVNASERIRAVFGSQFTLAPLFVAAAPEELRAAIAAGARPDFFGGDRGAPLAWLQRAGRTRERIARLTLALVYGNTPASSHRLDVAQLPEARRWVALPFDDTGPPAAATSLIVHSQAPVKMDEPLAGLLVDEWVEFVPRRSVTTGIAAHIDEPGARAPQTLLLAVPPDPGERWSLDTLIAVVNEAADLARIRTVGPDEVPWIGRIAPGLYFADNRRDDTLRLDFQRLVAARAP